MAVSRLERLLNLTAALLTARRPLTATEIQERVPGYPDDIGSRGAFHRAFERDKEALRDMGIPLTVRPVPYTDPPIDGYVIPPEEYALRDPGLEPDELAAIHLATAAVRLEGLRGTEALWKLGGAVGGATPVPASPVAALPAIPQLVPLFGAVAERRPVTFGYRGATRTLDPYRLLFSRGHWYLEGWDHDRRAERQFRLDRVEGEVRVGEAGQFERPTGERPTTAAPWQLGGDEPVEARVLIDADQAAWGVQHLGTEAVVARHADGAVEVAFEVTNRDAFRSFVLGFLEHAEVLEPVELRNELVDWLRRLAA